MSKTLNRFILKFSAGSLASAFIHGILLFVLIVGLPKSRLEPEKPDAIQVELISQPKKAEPKPLQKPKPIVQPAPKPKKTVTPEQAKVTPPKTLRPVYKFDTKDSEATEPEKNVADRDEKTTSEPPVKKAEKQPDKAEPKVSKPSTLKLDLLTPKPEQDTEAIALASINPAKPKFRPANPVRKPAKRAKTRKKARSRPNNKRLAATTAKGDLSRGLRAGKLCVTELRSQMNNSIPPHWPDRLPTYRLAKGNVLQVRKGAFRENARWINLKFRCEVDKAATEVVAFKLQVGKPVPRAEWRRRGLPGS